MLNVSGAIFNESQPIGVDQPVLIVSGENVSVYGISVISNSNFSALSIANATNSVFQRSVLLKTGNSNFSVADIIACSNITMTDVIAFGSGYQALQVIDCATVFLERIVGINSMKTVTGFSTAININPNNTNITVVHGIFFYSDEWEGGVP